MPWQTWSPPLAQSAPNWRGYAHGNKTYQQAYLQPYQQPSAYPQNQQNQVQAPSFQVPSFQQPNMVPQLGPPPQQLQLPSNQPPPRPTQLPAQPIPNPNNKTDRPMYNVDDGMALPYSILPLQNINLRSGKTLQKESPVILEEQTENEKTPKKLNTEKSQSRKSKSKRKNISNI